MKRVAVSLGLALFVGLLWLLAEASFAPASAPPTPPDGEPAATNDPTTTGANSPAAQPAANPLATAQAPERPERDPAGSSQQATIAGRCTDQDGAPLAGVLVAMKLGQGGDLMALAESELRYGKQSWTAPAPIETGTDGCFSFAMEPPRARRTLVSAKRSGNVSRSVWQEQLHAGDHVELGDVVMPRGCQLRGHVADLAGQNAVGERVSLRRVAASDSSSPAYGWKATATADSAGRFSIWSPVVPGEYEVRASGAIKPSRIVLHRPEQFVSLELQRPGHAQTITGQLRDRSGAPLRRRIEAKTRAKTWSCRSDEHGRFVLQRRADEPDDPVTIQVADEYGMTTCGTNVQWGSHDLKLLLDTGVKVPIQVVDGASGKPFEGRLGIRLVPVGGPGKGYSKARRLRQVGRHPGGLVTLPGILAGSHMVSVETATSSYAPTPYREILVGDAPEKATTISLWPPTKLDVRVTFGSTRSSAGSRVELLQMVGPNPDRPATSYTSPRDNPTFYDSGRTTTATVLADATTDEHGHALLVAPRGGPFAIQVSGDHEPYFQYGLRVAEDQELPIQVEATASIAISITPWPLPLERGVKVCFGGPTPRYLDRAPPSRMRTPLLDEHGRSRVQSLPAGVVRVELAVFAAETRRNHFTTLRTKKLQLKAGEVQQITFDVSELLPVMQKVRVLANGQPASDAWLRIDYASPGSASQWLITEQLDAAGAVELGVARGPVAAAVRMPGGRFSIPIRGFAFAAPDQTFDLQTADVTLKVLCSDGSTPLVGGMIVQGSQPTQRLGATDQSGYLQLGEIGLGTLRLGILPKGSKLDPVASGKVAMRHAQECTVPSTGAQTVLLTAPPESGY